MMYAYCATLHCTLLVRSGRIIMVRYPYYVMQGFLFSSLEWVYNVRGLALFLGTKILFLTYEGVYKKSEYVDNIHTRTCFYKSLREIA